MATEPGADEPSSGATAAVPRSDVSDEERTWGVLAHAGGFAGLAVPFGNVVAPLVVWLAKKDESRFVDENGVRALNFQVTWSIILLVTALSVLIAVGVVLFPLALLAWLILTVLGTVKASEGEVYDYPLTVQFVD
ncbi:DUF4870 domain-containing protein [Halobacteriales archaeon SW_12_69_24]|nr:MAG: DUF4870 domain-containing protein [Halobacteriales archaeon SW_12_69_24]